MECASLYQPPACSTACECRASVCGDGHCGPSEDCTTCAQDCGTCGATTTTSTTTTSCPTTTVPLTCIGSFSGACGSAPCPPGQTCVEGGTASCESPGPRPACGDITEPFCASGVCPAGMECASLYQPPACSTGCECRASVCGHGHCGPSEDCSSFAQDRRTSGSTLFPYTTLFRSPTTTVPLTCIGSFSGACGSAPCPPGQMCV